ncbi:MAG: ATP-binding cassette domain-containing protein [Candidatus Pristimantibacillus lignocellulolyticus]|uniref:ATP-binding cassette domain-containing protein n=1 Tax=Candidatus Pristimantibacillus lignocellulolyticus TaxID=2994561 RepID=A0A9J6ZF63_9BACL|nr:MAG: ATP-binding cassette domain-containing protein [Candidatus Pristimantibacillus lignocellulolyticus]
MSRKTTGAKLVVDNVYKNFGDKQVLKGIDFEIEPGKFLAIVGRSGCGKSTLLRLLAGLETPSKGEALLDGFSIDSIREDTRMLFQEARLLPWKRTVENVQIGMKSRNYEQALASLAQVGLSDYAHEWPSVLSGGQNQRVSLARALVSSPRLLLLDEPLGALDALTRIEMQNLIENLWLEQQFTTVLVTHDVDEAVALADRVILIEEGQIAFDVNITLARPRERNNDFIHFEKLILDRILLRGKHEQKDAVYAI